MPRRGRRRRSRKRKEEEEDEDEEQGEKEVEEEEDERGADRVDGEGTKRIEQCISFAEFVRLKRPQNWIRENLSAA